MSAEGFICPVCMGDFSNPVKLQEHFQTHEVGLFTPIIFVTACRRKVTGSQATQKIAPTALCSTVCTHISPCSPLSSEATLRLPVQYIQ
jgi:hypothetical protein